MDTRASEEHVAPRAACAVAVAPDGQGPLDRDLWCPGGRDRGMPPGPVQLGPPHDAGARTRLQAQSAKPKAEAWTIFARQGRGRRQATRRVGRRHSRLSLARPQSTPSSARNITSLFSHEIPP